MISVMTMGKRYQVATIAREAGIPTMRAVSLLKYAQEYGSVRREYETKNGFVYYIRVK